MTALGREKIIHLEVGHGLKVAGKTSPLYFDNVILHSCHDNTSQLDARSAGIFSFRQVLNASHKGVFNDYRILKLERHCRLIKKLFTDGESSYCT